MHIVCSITQRGYIFAEPVYYEDVDLAQDIFNHDFKSKTGFMYLLCSPFASPPAGADNNVAPARLTMPAKFDPRLVDGILKAVGKMTHIKDNYDLSDYVISNYDDFWQALTDENPSCLAFFETFVQSVGHIKRKINGVSAAIATSNLEVIELDDVGYEESIGDEYKVYVKSRFCEHKKELASLLATMRKLVESEEHKAKNAASAI